MDKSFSGIDWAAIPALLAVAETGSLSGAARRLSQSQPTLGRHIRQAEATLGTTLFTRHPRGLTLTEAGAALLPHARAMRDAAAALNLAAGQRDETLRGTVRVTASVLVSYAVLPAILIEARQRHPEIEIELVPSDATENLLFREADIAVRMYRPTQGELITRHVTDLPLGFYAATRYLDRRGRPTQLSDLGDHDLIGYDRSDLILRGMRAGGMHVSREDFALRCDDQATYWQLLRQGAGIGATQCNLGDADPGVERVLPAVPVPTLPVWLSAHRVIRDQPRIRAIYDLLAERLAASIPSPAAGS